jgi:hypothetical protein
VKAEPGGDHSSERDEICCGNWEAPQFAGLSLSASLCCENIKSSHRAPPRFTRAHLAHADRLNGFAAPHYVNGSFNNGSCSMIPLDPRFNEAVVAIANRLFPSGFDVSLEAPAP